MQQYLTEKDTIDEIRLASRHPIGKNYVWILVEGITDQKLYKKLMDSENTKVEMVHGGGIEKLREAMQILVNENRRVIGIRDADFMHLDQQHESIDNLFITDAHDAEIMLLSCDTVFQHLLAEHLPSESSRFELLRDKLLSSLAFIGGIRWLNSAESLELNFKGIGLADFYDATELKVNIQQCIQNIEKRSPNKQRTIDEQEINLKISGVNDFYNLCNGHDVVKALALYLTRKARKNIKDDVVVSALRMAYRKEDFAKTKLYASLMGWATCTGCQL